MRNITGWFNNYAAEIKCDKRNYNYYKFFTKYFTALNTCYIFITMPTAINIHIGLQLDAEINTAK